MGVVVFESVIARMDYEWLGALSFTWYYETTPVLTEGEYDLAGVAIQLRVAAVLLALEAWWFSRRGL
jgi:hypothetical protein